MSIGGYKKRETIYDETLLLVLVMGDVNETCWEGNDLAIVINSPKERERITVI